MKLAPLVSQPTEVWSELAAVVCAVCGAPGPLGGDGECLSDADDEPTVCERPDKERGAR